MTQKSASENPASSRRTDGYLARLHDGPSLDCPSSGNPSFHIACGGAGGAAGAWVALVLMVSLVARGWRWCSTQHATAKPNVATGIEVRFRSLKLES